MTQIINFITNFFQDLKEKRKKREEDIKKKEIKERKKRQEEYEKELKDTSGWEIEKSEHIRLYYCKKCENSFPSADVKCMECDHETDGEICGYCGAENKYMNFCVICSEPEPLESVGCKYSYVDRKEINDMRDFERRFQTPYPWDYVRDNTYTMFYLTKEQSTNKATYKKQNMCFVKQFHSRAYFKENNTIVQRLQELYNDANN